MVVVVVSVVVVTVSVVLVVGGVVQLPLTQVVPATHIVPQVPQLLLSPNMPLGHWHVPD
jgi:hypothetical protein